MAYSSTSGFIPRRNSFKVLWSHAIDAQPHMGSRPVIYYLRSLLAGSTPLPGTRCNRQQLQRRSPSSAPVCSVSALQRTCIFVHFVAASRAPPPDCYLRQGHDHPRFCSHPPHPNPSLHPREKGETHVACLRWKRDHLQSHPPPRPTGTQYVTCTIALSVHHHVLFNLLVRPTGLTAASRPRPIPRRWLISV